MSKLTPTTGDKIVSALEQGNFVSTAADVSGVHRATVYRWVQTGAHDDAPAALRDFRDAVMRARAEAEVKAVACLWDIAGGGHLIKETVTHRGREVTVERTVTGPDPRPIMFLLERGFPARWGRRANLEVAAGQDGDPGPIETGESDMEDDAIADLSARLRARAEAVMKARDPVG